MKANQYLYFCDLGKSIDYALKMTHVVASYSADLTVRSTTPVHGLFADIPQLPALGNFPPHKVDHLLIAETIPDAVASQDQEFLLASNVVHDDLGICGDDLSLLRKGVVTLEFEVSKSPGEGQVAVHPAKFDKASGSDNSSVLLLVPRLVVV